MHPVFADLAAAVEGLQVPLHRDALVALAGIRDRLDARFSDAVGAYEAAGHHETDGSLSMRAWLRHEAGQAGPESGRVVAQGRLLQRLELLRSLFLDGLLTGGQVDVIVATVPARHVERFAEVERTLLPELVGATVEQTERTIAAWRQLVDALDDEAPTEHDDELHLSKTLANRGELRGSFGADATAIIAAAVRVADCGDRDLTLAQRRAQALTDICDQFLTTQRGRSTGRHRPHVTVTMTLDELLAGAGGTYLDTGAPVGRPELGALLCDSVLHRLVHGPSGILDYGRSTYAVPVELYNAVAARDGGCRWPGCDRPAHWCDAHHVQPWEHGGSTSASNLVLLCRRHHRKAHAGWQLRLEPDGTLEVAGPDGRRQATHPPGTAPPLRRRRRPRRAPAAA